MTDYRITIRHTGGPEVLEEETIGRLEPGPGQILMRTEAIGLNFIDTYHRSGLYPVPLPSGLGSEAAGVVEQAGAGVKDFVPGNRVGIFAGPIGAYATRRIVPADRLVHLPDEISFEAAAATMLKGCTAEFLIERCARVQPGQIVLVYAAAGGVGSILVPWLKAAGAIVIAHAGSADKAALAIAAGADHGLSCAYDDLPGEVKKLSGSGADVIFDGVGAASWAASLGAVARRGLIVTYGNASGPVPPFSALDLQKAGSIFVTRPTLFDYVATPKDLRASAARLFDRIANNVVPVRIGARFPLMEAADAHRALESRATTGSTILTP